MLIAVCIIAGGLVGVVLTCCIVAAGRSDREAAMMGYGEFGEVAARAVAAGGEIQRLEVRACRAERGLALMARMHVAEVSRELSEWTGDPVLGVDSPEVTAPAAEFMQRVMARVDAQDDDGGLLGGGDDE